MVRCHGIGGVSQCECGTGEASGEGLYSALIPGFDNFC